MQGWIVGGAWLFAVLFAVVILGFAAYEVSWKLRRLHADQARLTALAAELATVGDELRASADRLR